MTESKECPECFGKTIQFWGTGKNTQYRICSHWQEEGHLTKFEINQKLADVQRFLNPSGRFA
jgi:hypothetical protein